ncbi:transcriptional repressor LexA [Alphaproteobacteria bacterium]|nr:transcriptional repressor LexA [Alphaproteobacteria bacterium]
MLTNKQFELLKYIENKLNNDSVAPSFEEMKNALNLKSKSGIHRLISALEERGYLKRLPNKARALEIIKLPKNIINLPSNNLNELESDNDINLINKTSENNVIQLPFLGKIAAGLPIEAISNYSNFIDVPKTFIKRNFEHFALEIEGDSMIDEGINDQDIAIIRKEQNIYDGMIIVALIDNQEATLKKFKKIDSSIALEPANKNYKTKIFDPERVKIQGKLVGIMRYYS